jgi:hypothetical protein
MSLKLAGVLDRCKTFDRPIDFAAVAELQNVTSPSRRRFYQEVFEIAERTGEREMAHAVGKVLARKPKRDPWIAKKFRGLRRRVFGR